jgi:hypothetical protein
MSTRLALATNAFGGRIIREWDESGPVPKQWYCFGHVYSTVMTMDARHGEWATRWACAPNGAGKVSLAQDVRRA